MKPVPLRTTFRQTRPPFAAVLLFFTCYGIVEFVRLLLMRTEVAPAFQPDMAKVERVLDGCRAGIVVIGTIIFGTYRALGFHPLFRTDYARWLRFTPWTTDKPLPLGPVHLVWSDALVVTIACLLLARSLVVPWPVAILAFLMAYQVCIAFLAIFTQAHRWGCTLLLGLGGVLLLLTGRHLDRATLLLLLLHPLAHLGLRASLRSFPWDEKSRTLWRQWQEWPWSSMQSSRLSASQARRRPAWGPLVRRAWCSAFRPRCGVGV